MSKQYYRQFPKITSQKVALAAGLRDREEPSQFGSVLSDKAIRDISLRLSLVNQLSVVSHEFLDSRLMLF